LSSFAADQFAIPQTLPRQRSPGRFAVRYTVRSDTLRSQHREVSL